MGGPAAKADPKDGATCLGIRRKPGIRVMDTDIPSIRVGLERAAGYSSRDVSPIARSSCDSVSSSHTANPHRVDHTLEDEVQVSIAGAPDDLLVRGHVQRLRQILDRRRRWS